MIYNLDLNSDADVMILQMLSAQGICEFCMHFNNKILTYFKDTLFGQLPKERNLLYKCHTAIQWYVGMLGRLLSTAKDEGLSYVLIHEITGLNIINLASVFSAKNTRILFELDSDLGTHSFMGIDPNILVQILDLINGFCIKCLRTRLKSPRELKLIKLCEDKVQYLSTHLRLVTDSLLFVNEKSYVHHLLVKMEAMSHPVES